MKSKRILAWLLSVAMIVALLPAGALSLSAAGTEYLVVDACDTVVGANFNAGGTVDVVDYKEGVGALSTTGSSDTVNILRQGAYNVTMPADWKENWYLDCWLYVSDPSKIPAESALELSQVEDQIEISWSLTDHMSLKSGWNKILLPLNSGILARENEFTTLKGIRLYMVNVLGEITVKLDNIVFSKGETATDTTALQAAMSAAETYLANKEDAEVRAALEVAKTAVTQADADAFAARLNKAMQDTTLPQNVVRPGLAGAPVTTYGRTVKNADGSLRLFWTNSGLSFKFNGTAASAEIATYNVNPGGLAYVNVYVDGAFEPAKTICLNQQSATYVLASGLAAGEHTVELRKRTEAAYGGSATFDIKTLQVTGEFATPPAEPAHQIEFIGDSITSGFANMVTDGNATYGNYTSDTVDGTMTYAVLAAKQLGANASVVSRSGIAYCHGLDATWEHQSFADYYTKTASLYQNEISNEAWDFAADPNDVVVINLGTNDLLGSKGGAQVSQDYLKSEAVAFLELVREKNPNAVIIWAVGIMGNGRLGELQAALQNAVQQRNTAGDSKVYFLALPQLNSTTEGMGTHGHPTIQTSIRVSTVLAQFIAEKTGWTQNTKVMLQAQIQYSAPNATPDKLAGYSAASTQAFTNAIAEGEALVAAGSASNAQYTAAANAIWNAYQGLVSAGDASADYIVIDPCDTLTGAQFDKGGVIDTTDFREGAGAFSTTGSSDTINILRLDAYNLTLPSDWKNWYFECWLYVSDPTKLPEESVLELSQEMDQIEIAFNLKNHLNLTAGWNKVRLPLSGASGIASRYPEFTTLKNIRVYIAGVSQEITVKLDYIVLSKSATAANTTAWSDALARAQALLATKENAALREAYTIAQTATSQADVDAFTARLNKAIEAAGNAQEEPERATIVPGQAMNTITTLGRTSLDANNALRLFWTNAGVTFRFSGTEALAEISTTNTSLGKMGYLNVYVDGEFTPSKTICLDKASATYVLAEGLTDGQHTIELRKRNEADYGGSATITIKTLSVDGEFKTPPAAPSRQIEFIGDSLTSGFADLVTDGNSTYPLYTSAMVEGTMTYAVLAAKQLGANASVLSRSGIAFARGLDNSLHASFQDYYTKTAALPGNTVSNATWNFATNPSDVVVINLGSNDQNGTVGGAAPSADYIRTEAVAFLRMVRENNPNAVIIWAYGMAGDPLRAPIEAAVQQLNREGDNKVYYFAQDPNNSLTEGVGTDGHPTVQAYINRSIPLAQFIAEKTGWTQNTSAALQAQLQWSSQYNNADYLAPYTPASRKAFTDAIAAGEALVAASSASNAQYTAAADAVWQAYLGLVTAGDVSSEYIVIDNCDTLTGVRFSDGVGQVDTTDFKEGKGALSVTGSSGTVTINHENTYNITMPDNWQEWYLECWLYVSDPTAIPSGSCLEISEKVDVIEMQWGLDSLGLSAGWNKLQLPLGAASGTDKEHFVTLKTVRLFVVNVTSSITVKLDNLVLSRGKEAADTAAWGVALDEASTLLTKTDDAQLKAMYDLALTARSQADVDAFTARLNSAIDAAESNLDPDPNPNPDPNPGDDDKLLGDVDGKGTVDSTDARLVLQYAVKKIDAASLDLTVADVDGNQAVDSTDARLILQLAVGKIQKFPKA